MTKKEVQQFAGVILGGFLFALSVNLFIVPLDLYSGGIVGIAQILRTIMETIGSIQIPKQFDIAGIINFIINIPLFIMAYKSISRKFFIKTLLCVIVQTISFSLIMIPSTPILDDVLASCVIGGLIGGFGIGLALRSSGSGGGLDILGVYFTKKFSNFSVGKLSLIVNAFVYIGCAVLFDVSTAIYSIIYMACFSLVVDKTHYQNINITCMIFSKQDQIQDDILRETGRGVTFWKGAGAYTKTDTYIMVTVINKYEISQIKKIIYKHDPHAFVIFNEGMNVSGNFEKRL
ncbi:YitT family protein [[Eubacterium] hominis]|uniref:YitT family protein n=1 Tax=[Eubacterium] hominis TaxID=2764325 RepID=UPI003A4DB34A